MAESWSFLPKVSRAKVLLYLESIYWGFLSIAAITFIVGISTVGWTTLFEKLENNAGKFTTDLLKAALIIEFICVLIQVCATFYLWKGVSKKSYKSFKISCVLNIASIVLLAMEILVELTVFQKSLPSIFNIFLTVYRIVVLKIIYDAAKELKRTPVIVPFVRIGNEAL